MCTIRDTCENCRGKQPPSLPPLRCRAVIATGAHPDIFHYTRLWRIFVKKKKTAETCGKIARRLDKTVDIFFSVSISLSIIPLSFTHSSVYFPSPPLPALPCGREHTVCLLNIKSENINNWKCRSHFRFMLVRNISDCKMWHARTLSWQPVAPFRAKRRAKRTSPFLPRGESQRPGVERGQSGQRERRCKRRAFSGCNNATGFFVDSNSEDSRTNKSGIGKRISGSVKTCLCWRERERERDKLSEL